MRKDEDIAKIKNNEIEMQITLKKDGKIKKKKIKKVRGNNGWKN